MLTFILRRIVLLVPLLLAVSVVAFIMVRLVPGDPVTVMMGENVGGAQNIALARHELGLDRPLLIQYFDFLGNALHGDLGTSIRSQRPVWSEITDRLPATLQLTLAAMALSILLGVGIGTFAAAARGHWLSGTLMVLVTLGVSIPTFWLGLLLIEVFAVNLRWLPVLGDTTLRGTILPTLTLALPAAAALARVTRASLLDVMRQDYIRTARAKGVAYYHVVLKHALRNGIIVVLTIAGLQFGGLLAGSVIVETVFSRPGLGSFVVNAIIGRDYPDIQGVVLVFAATYVVINTVIDILYGVINPRIRVA
jgi:ABC-type dipeptide/oligopeptide/nickel transport system permease component